MSDNKSKSGMPQGVQTAMFWVLGVGIIAMTLLILLILFGNLSGNFGFPQDSASYSNQTINLSNAGGTPTGASGRVDGSLASIVITNATGGETLTSDNYTVTGVVINASSPLVIYIDNNVNVSYIVSFDSQVDINAEDLIRNYTASATNTSAQFPVVGTIIGIAILLAVLIGLLIFAIRKLMGITSAAGGSGGSSSRKFGGSDSAGIA